MTEIKYSLHRLHLLISIAFVGLATHSFAAPHPVRLGNSDARCFLNSTWQCLMASLPAIEHMLPKTGAELEERLQRRQEPLSEDLRYATEIIFTEIRSYQAVATNAHDQKIYRLSDDMAALYRVSGIHRWIEFIRICINAMCEARVITISREDTLPDACEVPRIVIYPYRWGSFPNRRMYVDTLLHQKQSTVSYTYRLAGVVNFDYLIAYPRIYGIRMCMIAARMPAWLFDNTTHANGYVRYGNQVFYVDDEIVTKPYNVDRNNLVQNSDTAYDTATLLEALSTLLPGEPMYAFYTINADVNIADQPIRQDSLCLVLPGDTPPMQCSLLNKALIYSSRVMSAISCAVCIAALGHHLWRTEATLLSPQKNISHIVYRLSELGIIAGLAFYCTRKVQAGFWDCYTRVFMPQHPHPLSQITGGYPLHIARYSRIPINFLRASFNVLEYIFPGNGIERYPVTCGQQPIMQRIL